MSDFSVTELPLPVPLPLPADVDDVEEDADPLLLHPATSSATRTASAKGIRTEVRKRRNGLMNSSSLSPVGSDSLTAESCRRGEAPPARGGRTGPEAAARTAAWGSVLGGDQ
jgi:hypothetical protein